MNRYLKIAIPAVVAGFGLAHFRQCVLRQTRVHEEGKEGLRLLPCLGEQQGTERRRQVLQDQQEPGRLRQEGLIRK